MAGDPPMTITFQTKHFFGLLSTMEALSRSFPLFPEETRQVYLIMLPQGLVLGRAI
jgi:hypothetical protein